MELADPIAHRALSYAAAIQEQSYRLSVAEFEAYISKPDRRPGSKPVIRRVRELTPVMHGIAQASEGWRKAISSLVGPYREEVVEPGSPDESVVGWLSRLSWLVVEDDRIRVTQLGLAVLRHMEASQVEAEIPLGIVLNQGDELARARFFSAVAGLGPCAVVDRFFSIEGLLPVLQSTEVERVLTGTTDRAKVAGLKVALESVLAERSFELRKSDVFHDRFVIPREGSVWLLGTSVSGLGHRLSVMVELADEAMSEAIRNEFEQEWDQAEIVGQLLPAANEADDEELELGQDEAEDENAT